MADFEKEEKKKENRKEEFSILMYDFNNEYKWANYFQFNKLKLCFHAKKIHILPSGIQTSEKNVEVLKQKITKKRN